MPEKTYLPCDANDDLIPALRLKQGGAHAIAVTDTSAVNTTAFDPYTRVVSLYATGPVFLRFGEDDVTATENDHYYPAGIYYDVAIGAGSDGAHYTHLAVLCAGEDCTLYISEKC